MQVNRIGEFIKLARAAGGQGRVRLLTAPLPLVGFAGSVDGAILLSQIVFWSERTNDPEGWFYKSYAEWSAELYLSEYKVRKQTRRLVKMGLLETKIKKVPPGNPTLHYRLNWEALLAAFGRFLAGEGRILSLSKEEQGSEEAEGQGRWGAEGQRGKPRPEPVEGGAREQGSRGEEEMGSRGSRMEEAESEGGEENESRVEGLENEEVEERESRLEGTESEGDRERESRLEGLENEGGWGRESRKEGALKPETLKTELTTELTQKLTPELTQRRRGEAVEICRAVTGVYPGNQAAERMIIKAGIETEEQQEFWREVVEHYLGCGWNPRNIAGMEAFDRLKPRLPQTRQKFEMRPTFFDGCQQRLNRDILILVRSSPFLLTSSERRVAENRASNDASGIRDNLSRGSVGDFLKEKIKPESKLSIVSAYFTIYAFEKLKEQLLEIDSLDFLFGEPRFIKSLDPDKTDKKAFKIEDEGLQLANRLAQKRIAKECAAWIRAKVQIKSVRQANLLHGKMYHLARHGIEEAILGSSNFTVSGLGLSDNGRNNIELNLEVDSSRDRRDLKAWFDELWRNDQLVEDVKADVLRYLEQLYQNHTPEFIYFKTLFHIFEKFLSDQDKSGLLTAQSQVVDTAIWKALFEFQKDGVKAAINKILTHNGCIIADSVGLGKTFEALAVIKYFELRNHKVLVLCPKKLRENWTVYQAQNNSPLNPFVNDRFSYTVLSHTDLSREGGKSGDIDLSVINWGNYDLVVIDESHNFRNNTRGKRDEEGKIIRMSRYERLMEDIIKSGVTTKVLLLSATPVNNDLRDLRNQIYFLTEGRDDAFRESMGIANLQDTLGAAQRIFADWSKNDQAHDTRALLEKLSSAFFKLLDELTIARSRKHIQRYYQDSIAALGGFPVRARPISVFAEIDLQKRFMSYDRLNEEISNYKLSLFNPSAYVLPQYRSRYDTTQVVRNFRQSDREYFLIGMMKVNFLKRLESSVHSFAITLDRTITKIELLQDRIEQFERRRAGKPELDSDELEIEDPEDEELQAAMQVGGKFKYELAHLDLPRWLADMERDREQLNIIYAVAGQVSAERDAKLAQLKKLIAQKVQQPTQNKLGQPNRKVLVFTAFADTALYLYDHLQQWARQELKIHLALVTGGSVENRTSLGRNEFSHILTNFSPVAKRRAKIPGMPQEEEIDLLIATDCISEGQNLQDCDLIINYDIHWNPVRIIQRFGRIDRIGSINDQVHLVNFWPTPDLNKYINLKNRVEARMALVDIAATVEDNLLAAEVRAVAEQELSYRDKQLLRFKDEILDLEDFNETVTLNEFTLDDFRIELTKYIESNRQLLHDAPLGLYAVVPADPASPVIGPGVIYCLRQKGDSGGNEAVNPLQPYFLVYVREDKVVRFGFAQPKQILEIYRHLCLEKKVPYQQLCDLFDQQTQHGNDMAPYNELLEKAVESIERTFKKRVVSQLTSAGRGGMLIAEQKQVSQATDFDLITWLVIKG